MNTKIPINAPIDPTIALNFALLILISFQNLIWTNYIIFKDRSQANCINKQTTNILNSKKEKTINFIIFYCIIFYIV